MSARIGVQSLLFGSQRIEEIETRLPGDQFVIPLNQETHGACHSGRESFEVLAVGSSSSHQAEKRHADALIRSGHG